jgi:diadenosine tetraphosphatase ApaH/serine/threonine PP2A family protein phosphatase
VDRIVDLGDRVSGPLWPRETFELLQRRGIPGVRGNHDRLAGSTSRNGLGRSDSFAFDALDAAQRESLAHLPFRMTVLPGIEAFHATPRHDERYLLDEIREGRMTRADSTRIGERLGKIDARIVLCGHSHRAELVQIPDGPLIVNPGSVGCPAYDDPTGQPHVSEAGSPHARYTILDLGESPAMPGVEFRAIAYDFEAAACRAEANSRSEWAFALRTGFMPAPRT